MQTMQLKSALIVSLLFWLSLSFSFAQGDHMISVSGQGTVYAEPDIALVDFGIISQDGDLSKATANANAVISSIREVLSALGIEDKDIRTSEFNIWPQDRYNRDGEVVGREYQVNHTLTVTVRESAKLGEVLSQAVAAGANNVNNIRYSFDNSEGLEQQARALAMANAKAKASQLAELAEVSLGKVIRIEEGVSYSDPSPMPVARYAMAEMANSAAPVSGGQLAVSVSLAVVFAIE
ncbi:MAG: SIMPL domain-containing protein [Deinococcales bacterium]